MKRLRKKQEEELNLIESNEFFYYIIGYTSGGAAYGLTWEDAMKDGLIECDPYINDTDDLPF